MSESQSVSKRSFVGLENLESRLLLSVTYPEPAAIVAPSDDPTLPATMDTFDPDVSTITPDSGAPAFAEFTRMAGPDDTMVISGWQLSDFTGADHGKDTRFVAFGQTESDDAATLDAQVLTMEDDRAAVLLSDSLPDDSAYMLWAENADGLSYPAMVNTAETWWLGPDTSSVGKTVSIYGRNLSHEGGESTSWIYLQPSSGQGQWIEPTAVNPYKVDFTVPTELGNVDYEIWIHNGHGGDYGWADPLTLTVEPEFTWETNPANYVDVTDYGATGDDATDDKTAIQNAIGACSSGDTLYFPAGTYYLSAQLTPKTGIRWLGDGVDSTYLKMESSATSLAMVYEPSGGVNDVAFEDMTFESNGATDLLSLMYLKDCQDLHFTDLRLDTGMDEVGDLAFFSTSNVTMTGLEVIGTGISMRAGEQYFFDDCDFYGTNEAAGAILYKEGRISVVDCTFQHYDTSQRQGHNEGRMLWSSSINGGQRNTQDHIYVGGCEAIDYSVGPDHPDQNKGEMILWEHGGVHFSGTPTAVGTNTLTFSGVASAVINDNQTAVVIDGKGFGQAIPVKSFVLTGPDTGVVTLEEDWFLQPDTNSKIIVGGFVNRVAIYDNLLDGTDRVHESTTHIAANGVQPYTSSFNFMVDNNIFNDMRSGLSLWGQKSATTDDSVAEVLPSYFNQYANNTFIDNRWGAKIKDRTDGDEASFFGNVFRDNVFEGTIEDIMIIDAYDHPTEDPWSTFNVLERVKGQNVHGGLNFVEGDGAYSHWILRECDFDRGTAAYSGSQVFNFFETGMNPVLIDNTWTDFETVYGGSAQGADLETAYRVLNLSTPEKLTAQTELIVRNVGTSTLNWSVSDDAAWLSVSPSSGSVAAESSSSNVTVTADSSGLSTGDYTGTLTLSDGTNSMKVTVNFTVTANPLVAHLELDEGSGAAAADSSGSDNDGTLGGSPAWTTDTPDGSSYALSFDGVNDTVNLGNDASLNEADTITIAFWVKADEQNSYDWIVGKRDSGYGFVVRGHPATQDIWLRLDVDGESNEKNVILDDALTGIWNHVAWVIDAGSITGYLNGQQAVSISYTHGPAGFGNTDDMVLGYNPLNSRYFEGALDEFLFYDEALNASDIAQLYAQGVQKVTIEATDAEAAEASTDTGQFTVTRTIGTPSALTVDYAAGGSATSTDDYTALTGSVNIPVGDASATIAVTPVNDTDFELSETVELTLSENANYTIGAAGAATVTIADNENTPLVYFELDDGSGTTADDSSGNNNDGTLSGPTWVTDTPDADGTALQFDADNEKVTIANSDPLGSGLSEGDTVTVAFWVKGGVQDNYDWIVGKRDSGDGFVIRGHKDQNWIGLRMDTGLETNHMTYIDDALVGVWNHVAWVIDTGSITGYLNGQQAVTRDYDHSNGFGNTEDMTLGYTPRTGRYLEGLLDEFFYYDEALGSADIGVLYSQGRTTPASDDFESGTLAGGEGFVESSWSTVGVMDVVDTDSPYAGDYHLRMRDACFTQRTVDLTGYSSAKLELAWKAVSFETGDGATVEIYDNGSWSTLLTIDDDDDDGAWHTESIDLSSYTLNDEVIFRISADMGDLDDTLYIDDFAVIV